MDGDLSGTNGERAGTSGGRNVTSGKPRRVLIAGVALIVAYALLQLWANVGSILTERGADADPVTVWTLELTSLCGWFVVVFTLWHALPHMLPPRRSWPAAIVLLVVGALVASLLHVGVMVVLRELAWAVQGGDYSFPSGAEGFPYELRKDVADYALLVGIVFALRWYDRSAATEKEPPVDGVLEITDGARRIHLPHASIDRVEAAGNYVEVFAGSESYLHRSTMAVLEKELGDGFARIHRSRLVRRNAVRIVENDRSGDFSVTLDNGTSLRGSRRYRANLD